MASIRELFNVDGLQTEEAKKAAIESQAVELQAFVRGLRSRKAQVFTAVLKAEAITFDVVVTLSSLLLQANLYCRKTRSMMLLKQLFATELAEALQSFYAGEYTKTAEYLAFIRQVFELFTDGTK
ncbi:MAG: hypothetical protein NC218_02530 [Acetobacter sp.]|nr:hypothetical protein [Acetobacter sp.]